MKTYMATADSVKKYWHIVDATNVTLGRLATALAVRLRGKNKPEYTPHADVGDFVVVINAEKIKTTGKKMNDKIYYHHTGFPGGIKGEKLSNVLARAPEQALESAVKGMLPKGPLGRQMLKKLKIYSGDAHPHEAQKPKQLVVEDK